MARNVVGDVVELKLPGICAIVPANLVRSRFQPESNTASGIQDDCGNRPSEQNGCRTGRRQCCLTLAESGKIYPGNKLFALSRYEPVGVMIYNNAEFMLSHGKLLIKMYRQSLGSDAKPTIYEYLENFLEYIDNSFVRTEEQELINTLRIARDSYSEMRDIAMIDLNEILKEKRKLTIADKNNALQESINDIKHNLTRQDEFKTMKEREPIGKRKISRIVSDYGNEIDECIDQYFQQFGVDQSIKRSLHQVLRLSIGCDKFSRSSSGTTSLPD